MKKITIALIAGAALCSTTQAFAGNGYDITEDEGADYAVAFFDDDLTASSDSPLGDVIKTPPAPVRRTLLRPRTSFVRQLIQTVEQL